MIKTVDIRNRLKDIEEFLLESYREGKEDKKREWRNVVILMPPVYGYPPIFKLGSPSKTHS